MRSTKIFAAFAALVLAVSLVGLVASPAQAAKPKHDLSASPGKKPTGQLFIKGKVTTYTNKQVTIQRKLKGGSFKLYTKTPTDANGKFKVDVSGPSKSCFKVVVPATKNYRKTSKIVGCLE